MPASTVARPARRLLAALVVCVLFAAAAGRARPAAAAPLPDLVPTAASLTARADGNWDLRVTIANRGTGAVSHIKTFNIYLYCTKWSPARGFYEGQFVISADFYVGQATPGLAPGASATLGARVWAYFMKDWMGACRVWVDSYTLVNAAGDIVELNEQNNGLVVSLG
jgi:hypothetical protein